MAMETLSGGSDFVVRLHVRCEVRKFQRGSLRGADKSTWLCLSTLAIGV
jgi:hypothetical protein